MVYVSSLQPKQMTKVKMSKKKPLGRIVCPTCGNDREFVEVAHEVVLTNVYVQNDDGSFSVVESESDVLGEVGLYCSECETDVSAFHNHLLEMIF